MIMVNSGLKGLMNDQQSQHYSMFHQILGVDFFSIYSDAIPDFCVTFLGSFFHLPLTSLKILWNFVVYFLN